MEYMLTVMSDGDTVSQTFNSWEELQKTMKLFLNGKMDVECSVYRIPYADTFNAKGEELNGNAL